MSDDLIEWATRHLRQPASWESLPDDKFVELCVLSLIMYGTTRDKALVPFLFPLFVRLCDEYDRDARLTVMGEIKPLLDDEKLHAMALLPLAICDTDMQIVSSATLDLLAYSEIQQPTGLPYGLVELLELARNKVPRATGYVLGGLVVYGDTGLRPSMDTVALHCEDKDVADAARCRSGFLTHAAVDFWLAMCEDLQSRGFHGDESRFGLAASALVNMVRASAQPAVVDIVRRNPAPRFDPPIDVRQRWTITEYAALMRPRLQALADRESGEKIIPVVMAEWGLKYKTPKKWGLF